MALPPKESQPPDEHPMAPPVPQELVTQQPVKPLAIMAIAATNNAERMVHFLVSNFRVGSGIYGNRVFIRIAIDQLHIAANELAGTFERVVKIVESARSPRTVNSLIVATNRKIEQNGRDRTIGATRIRSIVKL